MNALSPNTLEINDTSDLNIKNFDRFCNSQARIQLNKKLEEKIKNQRELFLEYLKNNPGKKFYGITTAHHTQSKKLLDEEQQKRYFRSLPPTPPSTTLQEVLPDRIIKGIIFSRLTDYIYGTAPIELTTINHICDLATKKLPAIPALGLGDPGDIIPLGILFKDFPEELELKQGEGMFLVNGSPVATAFLADSALQTKKQINRLFKVIALAAVAIDLNTKQYDSAINQIWGDSFQQQALENLRSELEGYEENTNSQSPVCFRSAPRILGWHLRALSIATECSEISLSSPSSNPSFIQNKQTGEYDIFSNGGYHNGHAAGCIDTLARSATDIVYLLNHMINVLTDYQNGVTKYEKEPALSLLYMTAAGWSEEAKASCSPSLMSLAPSGQTGTSTSEALAWKKLMNILEALDVNLTILSILASHTLNFNNIEVPKNLTKIYDSTKNTYPYPAPHKDFSNNFNNTLLSLKNIY